MQFLDIGSDPQLSQTIEGNVYTLNIASINSQRVGLYSVVVNRNGQTAFDDVTVSYSSTSGFNSVIISVVVVMVVAALALALLAIVCCVCIRRSRGNRVEMRRVSTKRMRKLSDQSTFLDYQMQEIVKFVPESMRIPSSNLKLQNAVGQGAFGIVYKGLLMDWNNIAMRGVALKTLKGIFTPNDVESMVSEISKMQEFHHPHVMPLIGVCLDAGPGVSIVMPYMTYGSLLDYLKKERSTLELAEGDNSDKVFSVRKLLFKICHQIALGMAYLAQNTFVHRDLAARNCMLDSNGDVKVGDFGLAEDVYSTGYFRQSDSERVKLPYKWLALESLNDAIFNEKTDVWSYGVTVWEVFSGGRIPYPALDPMSLVALLREGRRLEPPQNVACSTEIVSLMARCWCENSENRPSFDELAAELDRALTTMVGYVELNMELKVAIPEEELEYDYVLSLEGQIKLAKASTEEVAMETNAAYGLRAKDQLQTEEVLVEAYGIRKDLELNMEIVAITEDESECDFVLSPKEQMKLAEATTEEVVMETNAAYGLRARDQLQTKQVLTETNVAYGIRSEQENLAKRVIELADLFTSESQKPLRNGYRGYNVDQHH
ncbi:tyrosine-protein kinase receptor UFO-like [Halichondria panicea]|uniref:tyrosine-protein kinase receptor UFO-like n=1 Tax=Halichondria panicea TaxID=6063 RepID=UPI00312B388B